MVVAGHGIGVLGGDVVAAGDGELVPVALVGVGRGSLPHPAGAGEGISALDPMVPVPHHRHRSGIGRPQREVDASVEVVTLEGVRAQPSVEIEVAAVVEQVEIQLRHLVAHRVGHHWSAPAPGPTRRRSNRSRTVTSPAVGTSTQSGRWAIS